MKDTNQAELITTILFSFDNLKETYHEVTENMIYQYILEWKKRFSGYQSELKIRELIKSLTGMNLIATDYTKDHVDDIFFKISLEFIRRAASYEVVLFFIRNGVE